MQCHTSMNRTDITEIPILGPLTPAILLSLIFLIMLLPPSGARTDAKTGRIRVLYIGDSDLGPGYPAPAMIEDPKIQLTRIEAEIGTSWATGYRSMQRWLRLYLPRSEDDMVEKYDMLIIAGIRSEDLKARFHVWTKAAVEDHGFGLLMADDATSFGTTSTAWTPKPGSPWDPTPIGQLLPVEGTDHASYRDHLFRLRPVTQSPLTGGIDWEDMPMIWSTNRPHPKSGSTTVAVTTDETHPSDPKDDPALVYWDVGKGRTLAFIFNWAGHGMIDFYRWEYWKDVIARMVYFPARASIPEVAVTHELRMLITKYNQQMTLLLSVIEFAEGFGANTNQLYEHLAITEGIRNRADDHWMDGEYGMALEELGKSITSISGNMQMALEAKDRALTWVYIIEWLSVAGTSVLTGFLVWEIMIRGKLYQETKTTTFDS